MSRRKIATLETHPDLLILDQDDTYVFLGLKLRKGWLGTNLRFFERSFGFDPA
jgi:hypothetical protein